MDLKQLESFVEIVRTGSFTKAGEKLFVSQPTVSTHVRQLEEELGMRLVRRTTKNVELTDKGQEVYEYALGILNLRDRMIASCHEEEERILHLGVSTIPSSYILPRVLPAYLERHPETHVDVQQSDSQGVIDRIRSGIFDIGMVGMQTDDEELVFRPFCRDHMVFITPNRDRFREWKEQGGPVTEKLLREPMILREEGSGSKKMAARFLDAVEAEPGRLRVVARINDQETIKKLVAEGVGISIVSQQSAQDYADDGRVLTFEIEGYPSDRYLYLVYRKNALLSAREKGFMRFVMSVYENDL